MSQPTLPRAEFRCIDAHTCGNPVRVVTSNAPTLDGATMSERRQHFIREFDWIRTGLMFEPRGHDAMSGSILYPPSGAGDDLSVLFIEVSGCLPMCGHGAIGTVTVALEEGLVTPTTPGLVRLNTPAGPVQARYALCDGLVESVTLTNVPSFLHSTDLGVEVSDLGRLTVDVSYGGNFYAIIEPQGPYRGLDDFSVDQIRHYSPLVRDALNEAYQFIHPENATIRGVSHIMWTDQPRHPDADHRNVVLYGARGIDRSPCGTGTSARVAQLVARGELALDHPMVHESIIGSLFTGRATAATTVGDFPAIVPTIQGWARITGHNTIFIDERDPYARGFLLV